VRQPDDRSCPIPRNVSVTICRIESPGQFTVRLRNVPKRQVLDQIVLARPSDGTAIVLHSAAALIWYLLEEWTDFEELALLLTERYPTTTESDRERGLTEVLGLLEKEDLLERRQF
jgi:hypothetical protein